MEFPKDKKRIAIEDLLNSYKDGLSIQDIIDKNTARLELYLGRYNKDKKCYTVKAVPEGLFYEVDETTIEGLKKDKQFFIKSN